MASSHRQGNIINSPHFFKIILQDAIWNKRLKIPQKFVKNYGNRMSSPAILRVPTGAVWKVELENSDGKIWLKNGWQEFSNHYFLELGHFLVFRYEGKSKFHVLIFDRTASEIEYPCTINNQRLSKETPEQNNGETEDDESIHIMEEISPGRKMREKPEQSCPRPPKIKKSTKSAIKNKSIVKLETQTRHGGSPSRKGNKRRCHEIQGLKAGEKSEALQKARSAFEFKRPCFLVVIQPTYVGLSRSRRSILALPTKFARKYLREKQCCEATLCNSNGKTWTVTYFRQEKFYASLRTGWLTFVHDNNIQVGDVCAFELINCIEIVFKVVIYQGQTNRPQPFASTPVKKDPALHAPKSCRGPMNASRKAKTIQIAHGFKSENPYFVVVLLPSYVNSSRVGIPEDFARKYLTRMRGDVTLHLSNGKSWPMKYYKHSLDRPSARLYSGWRKFVMDNNIEVGDVCIFELTEGTETSLKVTILKKEVVEDGRSGSSATDKGKENQVEHQESLEVKTEPYWVIDGEDMSSL